MSDYAGYLAALTSVYPFGGLGYIDSGDSHSLGPIDPPGGCVAILAGVDVQLSGPLTGVGQILLYDQATDFSFWCGPFPMGDYEVAAGCYRSYRGGFIMQGESPQVNIQYLPLGGLGVDVNYAYWGYYIPAGWSPVGLPPQQ